jgi:hypothetical protein
MEEKQKKALDDLSVIRDTVEKVNGAEMFRDFMYSMGTMLIVFGVIFMLATGATYYLLEVSPISNGLTLVYVLWGLIVVFGGTAKTILFYKKGKAKGLNFMNYLKKVINKSFLDIDLPLELASLVLIVFFVINGHLDYILPYITLVTGVLFGSLGGYFRENSLKLFGYIFIVVSAVGFFFMLEHLYLFTILAYGVLYTAWGMVLHQKCYSISKKVCEEEPYEAD